jgi:hypothetical protein
MTVLVKGYKVIFKMKDGSRITARSSYGIIHDPEGQVYDRCTVYVGPVVHTKRRPNAVTSKAKRYYGSKYQPHVVQVEVPTHGPWKPCGEVVEILYERTKGSQYEGKYFHIFKRFSPKLLKCKSYYRLELQGGCIVDDRGFVFP